MKTGSILSVCVLAMALIAVSAAPQCQSPKFSAVVEGKGRSTQRLSSVFNFFISLLGGDNNASNPGPLPSGHRSINWDAGIVPFKMPGDFFDAVVTRGAKLSTVDGKFRVSNPVGNHPDDKFSTINHRASKEFLTFSPERLFTPLNYNTVTITFTVPAKGHPALVKGFGAVFVDVDLEDVTKATYYDKSGCVLKEAYAIPQNRGLSFLGVVFDRPIIAKVELTLGARAIGKPWNGKDIVVLDDFLYGEPQAI